MYIFIFHFLIIFILTFPRGYKSIDEIDLKDIEFVYAPQLIVEGTEIITNGVPCWKITYEHEGEGIVDMIEAIYGDSYIEYPQ